MDFRQVSSSNDEGSSSCPSTDMDTKKAAFSCAKRSLSEYDSSQRSGSSESSEPPAVSSKKRRKKDTANKKKKKSATSASAKIQRKMKSPELSLRGTLTTAEGQLEANPHWTREQAEIAARREYNRRNAARGRLRNKNQLAETREKYHALTKKVEELQNQNRVLEAKIEVMHSERETKRPPVTPTPPPFSQNAEPADLSSVAQLLLGVLLNQNQQQQQQQPLNLQQQIMQLGQHQIMQLDPQVQPALQAEPQETQQQQQPAAASIQFQQHGHHVSQDLEKQVQELHQQIQQQQQVCQLQQQLQQHTQESHQHQQNLLEQMSAQQPALLNLFQTANLASLQGTVRHQGSLSSQGTGQSNAHHHQGK